MAESASPPEKVFAQFSFYWKIEWSTFNSLTEKSISRSFVASYENVPMPWSGEFSCLNNFGNTIAFGIFYEGHREQIFSSAYVLDIVKEDHSVVSTFIGNPETWQVVARGNPDALQSKFNLTDAKVFCCKITLKIPLPAFQYCIEFPFLEPSPTWMFNLFENITSPQPFSNIRMVSRDGKVFYCHKAIIEYQSEPMAAMFRQPHSKRDKSGTYDFPALGDAALNALLQYLYTGLTTISDLTTATVVELIDAAEQYGLKQLKLSGIAALWKRASEKPSSTPGIIRVAHLHDDMKELKLRAMDILIDNYHELAPNERQRGDGGEEAGGASDGQIMTTELLMYSARRITPCGMTEK